MVAAAAAFERAPSSCSGMRSPSAMALAPPFSKRRRHSAGTPSGLRAYSSYIAWAYAAFWLSKSVS
jgi:hypothetical protein